MRSGNKAVAQHVGRQFGFTLIELMITVAIVGILASVAYPSYQDYIIRANRSTAQQFMLDIANREEQYLLDARTYTATIGTGGLNLTAPTSISGRYTFSVTVAAGPPLTYTITATPTGPQTGDLYDPIRSSNSVGPLTLDSLGQKGPAVKWTR
jgi:type IV pilus assembly protein PilE